MLTAEISGKDSMTTMNKRYSNRTLPPGTMIEEYCLDGVVGQGSFGIVYVAKNTYLPETVAIKEFLPDELADRIEGTRVVPKSADVEAMYQKVLKKFLDEARILFELSKPQPHPQIVRVTRLIKANGTGYMVMDYERGEPLSGKLKEPPRTLPESELRDILFPLLDGLETVHAASVTHRDIKPENILIRSNKSPVLIDFGAARRKRLDGQKSQFPVFTPDYAAPEQYYDIGEQGPWTDIYALGATLYRAVTGEIPTNASARLRGEDYHRAVDVAGHDYTPAFLAAIDKALALQPKDRPKNIKQWRSLFKHESLENTIISSGSPPDNKESGSGVDENHRHRLFILLSMLSSVAIVGIAVLIWRSEVLDSTPPIDPEAIFSEVKRIVNKFDCAQVEPEVSGKGRLILSGYVSSRTDLEYLHAHLPSIAGVQKVEDSLVIHPAPFCQVIGLLSAYQYSKPAPSYAVILKTKSRLEFSGGSVDEPSLDFKEGQFLVVYATASAAFPGYLYVDYFDSAGDVIHMLPSPIARKNDVSAGQQVILGDKQPCPPKCYEIMPPHGQNMIVAISSSIPLFDQQRPEEVESLSDYLPALRTGFRKLHAQGGEIISTFKYITTHE